jgi:hypothetical protein
MLPLVQNVAFDGDATGLRVRAVIDVPEGGVAPASGRIAEKRSAPAGASPGGMQYLPSAGALLPELRGARFAGHVAVTEALANEAIRIALDGARAGGSGESNSVQRQVPRTRDSALPLDPGTLARWVRKAGVRFQNGRIVLEPDILVE